jgi:hypothetical protein
VESNAVIPLDKWTHVAGVYRDGTTRLLINGRVDKVSHAIVGPVPDNGRNPFVGADNNATGPPDLFFTGALDEVRIVGGARHPGQISQWLFTASVTNSLIDETGVARTLRNIHCEPTLPSGNTYGSDAHWIQSGVPLYDQPSPSYVGDLDGIFLKYTGKEVEGLNPPVFYDTLVIPMDVPITDVNVFVNLEFARVDGGEQNLLVRVMPPGSAPDRNLFSAGPDPGRDLQTYFDDESPHTIDSTVPPFLDAVQPRDLLSGLDGYMSGGTWVLLVSPGSGTSRCRLNQWGVEINGITTISAPAPRLTEGVWLRTIGAHPVREEGVLEFSLTRSAKVELDLYDVRGARIRALMSGFVEAGVHQVPWNGSGLASGIYWARLAVDGESKAEAKIVLTR